MGNPPKDTGRSVWDRFDDPARRARAQALCDERNRRRGEVFAILPEKLKGRVHVRIRGRSLRIVFASQRRREQWGEWIHRNAEQLLEASGCGDLGTVCDPSIRSRKGR